jgi:hypothetical protein
MDQLHKRFTNEQVKFLFEMYCQGLLKRDDVQKMLVIGKTRFFALLKKYRQDCDAFSISYNRAGRPGLSSIEENALEQALLQEKALVENKHLPISCYNYSAMRERLEESGVNVSVTTIIKRAKTLGCHKPRKKSKPHDRQVLTASIGALIQHDASTHLWAPFAQEKWVLITSIDDFSRKLLFADFVRKETTWAHIRATQALMEAYGFPLRYYVDSLRVFRFVQGRDSVWRKHVLHTDDVETQWGKMMSAAGVEVIFADSPQAKGKIERPYGWLQDHIVRTCVYENVSSLEAARSVLRHEVDLYNNRRVHSVTKEIPSVRFENARLSGNSLFRPFALPQPYTSTKDLFCLRETRVVNAYRSISLFNHKIQVPNVALREQVEVHLIPNIERDVMDIRIWWHDKLVHCVSYPLRGFSRVHF